MDQRERINEREESLRTAIEGLLTNVWTALPGIVQSYNPNLGTCVIQPSIKARIRSKNGTITWVALPLLVDVPIIFPGGGIFVATFPIQQGDEALVIFSSRCIDAWWQQGGVQLQAELRMHDLSDGFAIVGPRSIPRALTPPPSVTTAQLRTVDGTAYIELAPGGVVNIVAPGGVNVTGALVATGEVTAKSSHTVSAHIHGGVTTGGGNTGGPTG